MVEKENDGGWLRKGFILRGAALILVIGLLTDLGDRFGEAQTAYRAFKQAGGYRELALGPYEHRRPNTARDEGTIIRIFEEAKHLIPAGSKLAWSVPKYSGMLDVAARFALAPPHFVILPDRDWDYFIDATNQAQPTDPRLGRHQLNAGGTIYSKPGKALLSRTHAHELDRADRGGSGSPRSWTLTLITIFSLCLGASILLSLGVKPGNAGMSWYLGCSYLVGFLVTTTGVYFLMLLGGRLRPTSILLTWFALGAVCLVFSFRRLKSFRIDLRVISQSPSFSALNLRAILGALFCLAIVGAVATTAFYTAVDSWDDRSTWVLKAKAFFHFEVFNFRKIPYREYPLLWPLNLAVAFALAGSVDDGLSKGTVALLNLALASQLFGGLRLLGLSVFKGSLLVALFFTCFYSLHLTTALAEVCFLAFLAAGVTALLGYLEGSNRGGWLALSFLFGTALCHTKLEGGPTWLILIAALALTLGRECFSLRHLVRLGILLIPIVSFLAFLFFHVQFNLFNPENAHLKDGITLRKIGVAVQAVLESSKGHEHGYELIVGSFLWFIVAGRGDWNRAMVFLGLAGLGLIAFIPLAIAGWPEEIIIEGSTTATPRLLLHATPLILIFGGSLLSNPKETLLSQTRDL